MWLSDVACFFKKAGLDNHQSPVWELQLPEGICAAHSFSTAKTVEGLTTVISLVICRYASRVCLIPVLCIFGYSDTQKIVSWDDSLMIVYLYNNFTKHYCWYVLSVSLKWKFQVPSESVAKVRYDF